MFSYNPNIYTANLDKRCVNAAIAHAKKEFPNEACGAIIDGHYIKFKNEYEDPTQAFEIKDNLFYEAYSQDKVSCLVHSHNDFNQASLVDQQQQRELEIPSLIINLRNRSLLDCIVFGDTLPIAPLLGRPFFYGAFDCVALIYDYLRINLDTKIPNPPREWAFWMKGISMFEEHLSESVIPFYEVPIKEMTKGDVLLYNVDGTKYINHIAVMISDKGEVIHHLYNNVSSSYPISFHRRYLRKVMRFNKNWKGVS